MGGRFPSESVAGFDRNGWPASVGIGGRFASESAATSRFLVHAFSPAPYELVSMVVFFYAFLQEQTFS
jgi:hypothetical protein